MHLQLVDLELAGVMDDLYQDKGRPLDLSGGVDSVDNS